MVLAIGPAARRRPQSGAGGVRLGLGVLVPSDYTAASDGTIVDSRARRARADAVHQGA